MSPLSSNKTDSKSDRSININALSETEKYKFIKSKELKIEMPILKAKYKPIAIIDLLLFIDCELQIAKAKKSIIILLINDINEHSN